jgi:tight adherence protein B
MTSEATMSGWVIGALPLFVGGFVMFTQPTMRTAMFTTWIGHLSLIIFFLLEFIGIFAIRYSMRLEI